MNGKTTENISVELLSYDFLPPMSRTCHTGVDETIMFVGF